MRKLIVVLLLFLVPAVAVADDTPFRLCKLSYHTLAFMDYWTTYQASWLPKYQEQNKFTRLYWRSPPAFSAFKAVETVVLDRLFTVIYKKNKLLGFATVIVFAVVRYIAFSNNARVMRIGLN